MTTSRAILWGLFLLLIVRVAAMIWVPLTDPTEARYAEIARKMAETGNWITPLFDYGVPFWAKPPLHTWLSALGIAGLGVNPFAARLGILISALVTLLILWLWGRTLTDRVTAGVAVLVTASSGLFFVALGFVQTDMALTLGVTASMAGFYGGLQGKRRWGWLFFLGLAIGLLAKGPVATVLTMMPITLYMLWRGDWKDLLRLPLVGGTVLVAVLVLPWYLAAEIATPGYLYYFIVGEHIQRFLQPGWSGDLYGAGRAHPKGMIWVFWFLATLPWSPLLPLLLWRLRKGLPRTETPGTTADRSLYVYLLLFALAPLVLFTPAANIIITYVLPGVPAAALLSVILWVRIGPAQPKWLHLGVSEVLVVSAGLTVVAFLGLGRAAIPSEASLIEAFDGSGRLAIFNSRSFSAEFYTQGKITRLKTLDDVSTWMAPGDGVLVPKYRQGEFVARFGDTLTPALENRKYLLYRKVP